MSKIVVYDPSDPTVAGRVTQYNKSAHTPDYDGESNKLVDPDLDAVNGVPLQYWKHSTGSVVEMSQPEKDAVDALFDKYAGKDGFTTVIISSKMFSLFQDMEMEEDDEFNEMMSSL